MVKVKFTAKRGLPDKKGGKRWLHRKASMEPYADGSGRTHLVPAVWFDDGGTYDVTQWEADVLLSQEPYKQCFQLVSTARPVAPIPDEEDA